MAIWVFSVFKTPMTRSIWFFSWLMMSCRSWCFILAEVKFRRVTLQVGLVSKLLNLSFTPVNNGYSSCALLMRQAFPLKSTNSTVTLYIICTKSHNIALGKPHTLKNQFTLPHGSIDHKMPTFANYFLMLSLVLCFAFITPKTLQVLLIARTSTLLPLLQFTNI